MVCSEYAITDEDIAEILMREFGGIECCTFGTFQFFKANCINKRPGLAWGL